MFKNIKINQLIKADWNYKEENKRLSQKLKNNIKKNGIIENIIVRQISKNKYEVVNGNHRLDILRELKVKHTMCYDLGNISLAQAKRIAIETNETKFGVNEEKLTDLINDISNNFGLEDLSYTIVDDVLDFADDDLDFNLELEDYESEENVGLDVLEDKQVEQDDFTENIKKAAYTKKGDIWILGKHRLLCGSSTSQEDVNKLMNGETSKMLFTSPPYSDMREYNGEKDLKVDNIVNFIKTYREYVNYQIINLGLQRKNNEIFPYWNTYIDKAKQENLKFLSWSIWNRNNSGSIGNETAFIPVWHEWIFIFGKEIKEKNRTKINSYYETAKMKTVKRAKKGHIEDTVCHNINKYGFQGTVFNIGVEKSNKTDHPAVFPVQLPAEFIAMFTKEKDIVVEPFCGSGTTIIASEQLKRVCYGMELDEKYCDIIVDRYVKHKANFNDVKLIRNSKTIDFKDIKEEFDKTRG